MNPDGRWHDKGGRSVPNEVMLTILIIDEEPALRELLSEWLIAKGYQASGRSAVGSRNEDTPTLVILDVPNLRIEGIRVVREVKRIYPLAKLIGMSALLGRSLLHQSPAGLALGVRRLIAKPCARDELLDAVADAIGAPGPAPEAPS